MESIITKDMEHCFECGSPYVQVHHCLHGTANRKLADKYKLIVPLCVTHHTGAHGVHKNALFDLRLKKIAQKAFEREIGTREDFMKIFGKNYL